MTRVPSRGELALGVLVPLLVLAVSGIAGGALWAWLADPPSQRDLTGTNAELLLGQQFAVDATYAFTGLGIGFAVGLALAWWLRRCGWPLVLGTVLGSAAAAVVSYALGMWWGPGPTTGVPRDHLLSGAMAVHAHGVFLFWPVGALLGLLLAVWLTDRHDGAAPRVGPIEPRPGPTAFRISARAPARAAGEKDP